MHADDLAICFLRQVERLRMDVDHVGVLLRVAAVVQVDAQRSKQFRRREIAQTVQIRGVV